MKPENPSASHPAQPPVRHQFEHEVPTVIHDPEADMTALGRWFHHLYQNPTKFWGYVATVLIGVLTSVTLANYFSSTRSSSSDVWTRLDETKKPAEKVELIKEYPGSPATTWALLQAATEFYQDGFGDLPNNRDAALPALKKALDLFEQVAKEAPKDSPQARHAVLGKARTLEARNELPKAIEQYKLVATNWPGTPEATMAESLAKALETPGAAEFYKELYAYQPAKVSLPPLGGGSSLPSSMSLPGLDLPSGIGAGALPSSSGAGSFPFLPPPPPSTKPTDSLPPLPSSEPKVKPAATPAPKVEAPAVKIEVKPAADPKANPVTTPTKP